MQAASSRRLEIRGWSPGRRTETDARLAAEVEEIAGHEICLSFSRDIWSIFWAKKKRKKERLEWNRNSSLWFDEDFISFFVLNYMNHR